MAKNKKSSPKPRQKSARAYALDDLLKWYESSEIKIRKRTDFVIPADFGLYRAIISNVIRYCERYLYLIGKITNRSLNKLDDDVQVVLMIGLAQLDQDGKVDEYAVVNETVQLMAYLKKPFLKGFINGNLRSYLRTREKLEMTLQKQKLSIKTSHPNWMIKRWEKFYGDEQAKLISENNNINPSVHIVLNPTFDKAKLLEQLTELGFKYEKLDSNGYLVNNPSGLFDTELNQVGAFLVQDFSAQLLNSIIKPLPKKRLLDACASPGGKLFHFEWEFGDEIEKLVGFEISEGRIERLLENSKRYKSKAEILLQDALLIDDYQNQFDCVILDAPCSATGTIRKHPEIKWSREIDDFKDNQQNQLQLLNQVKKAVCKDGYLIYSTCSLEPEENQEVVASFLKENQDVFELVKIDPQNIPSSFISEDGCYQHLTSQHGMAAFAALFKRK